MLQCKPPANVEEMIEMGVNPLLKRELIGLEYQQKLLKMIKQRNHPFVITEGVIFPHASSEKGIFGTGISLVTFKNPVKVAEVNQPIWLMITLAAEDNERHVEALALIIEALNDELFLEKLKSCHDKEEIMEWFQKREGASL